MNTHEIERIAAAFHQLRPDWPAQQLRTLLADERLHDRPRRDVVVALGWIACESGTASPYRVLETGPWWRAVATDGASTGGRREWADDAHRCRTCSLEREECRRRWHDDHAFEPAVKPDPVDTARAVAALRDIKATETPPVQPHPATTTAGTDRLAPVRAAIAASTETEETR